MKIYFNGSYIEIQPDDKAYRSRRIMGEDALYLSFEYQGYLNIPVGAYCVFDGTTYYLLKPSNFKKNGTRKFSYDLTLQADSGRLSLYRFKNPVDRRIKFEAASRPEEYLTMIVANMNQRDSGWSVGSCIVAGEKLLSFNHNTVAEALDMVAKEFDTEWSIEGKVISLGKLEKFKENPIALSYGKGNGFIPGLGRSNYDNSRAFEILYVQGGERNIDYSTYGSKTLLLPKGQELSYDGQHFDGEPGFVASRARRYIVDDDGVSIRRIDKTLSSLAPEDSYDCSESYPKRVGSVSSWVVVDASKGLYDFIDTSIPSALDYNNYMIEGETLTVIFQSGMLAGREFDLSKYDHATRRFEIVPAELDGQTMPNDIFKAAVGDEYAIFGCTLPDSYICDNQTRTGASWDMFKQAVKYMFENEDPRFSFNGVLDGRWAAAGWSVLSGRLVLGGIVSFSDTQFLTEAELIRIIGIKQYVNKPHYPELQLSNATVTSSIATELNEYKAEEVTRDSRVQESIQFTKRRWRDLQETAEMLAAAIENYSEAINPISVQTMQLIAGDESLQFRFVTSKVSPITVDSDFTILFDSVSKRLAITGGLTSGASILQHMTIGIATLSSQHDTAEYHFWDIPAFVSEYLNDTDKKYYVYAKVGKSSTTGQFILSETAIGMESVAGYYHLLLGILNSEFEGTRSFAQTYGYTEVLPGRITTDRIVASDGINYFDLQTGELNMSLPNGSQFIKFDENGVHIKGKVVIGAGSSGLAQFTEYPSLIAEIQNRTPYNILLANENAGVACRYDGTVIGALPTSAIQVFYGGSLQSGWAFSLNCTGCTATVANGVITVTGLTADNATVEVTATKTDCPTLKTTMNIIKVRGGGSGVGVQSIEEEYYLSTSPTSLGGGSWGTTVPTWVDGKYIWTRSVITYTDSSSVTTDPVCVTGGKGSTGDDGVGIAGVDVEYYLSESSSQLIGGQWSTTAPAWVNGKYMWSRTHTTYTDGDEDYSDPCCITGAKGEQGIQGPAGQDGRTTYFHVKYSPVANPTDEQMTETPSDYIGTYVDYNPVDSLVPSDYTWSRFKGEDGDQGIPGQDGEDGTTYYLHIAYANSQDGTEDFSTSVSQGKSYIGQYVDENEQDSQTPSDYNWSLIKGEDAVLYMVQPSVSVVKRTWGGTITPSTITCKKYKIVGNQAAAETTEKVLKYSIDGAAETAYSGQISINSGMEYIDFRLYDTDGTTLLDSQRILILNDASEFDVEGMENAIAALEAQMVSTQSVLEKMNSDKVFDATEKAYIRTLWENVNGLPSLDDMGANGSYISTLDIVERSGYATGKQVALSFAQNILKFNEGQDNLMFKYTGLDSFNAAYFNLRDYLRRMQLYDDGFTEGYDREYMASLFTTYYDAQEILLENSQFYYANAASQSAVQTFIEGEYASDIAAVRASIDKKAETFVQSTDPASGWTSPTDVREQHVGDIWWNNGNSTVSGVSSGATAVYRYDQSTSTYYWEETPVPKDVFDKIDGKKTIYTAIPNTAGADGKCYHKDDLWIMESGLTADLVPADAKVGDLLVASSDSTSYNKAHWSKKVRYTDDSALNTFLDGYSGNLTAIRNSIDKKAETWYQATDPSTAWTTGEDKAAHKGDIWHNTSNSTINGVKAGQDAIWSGTAWSVDETVPQEVYDKIDGKSAIYVTWNAWIVNNVSKLQLRDVFIPAEDTTQGGVTYKQNHFYRCINTNPATFAPLSYVDTATLNDFIQNTYQPAIDSLKNQIDGKAETYVQSSDPAAAWTTTEAKKEHVGDMWLNSARTAVSGIGSIKTAIYTQGGTEQSPTFSWAQQNIPNQLFDEIDGKASLYIVKPANYHAKDMWIIGPEIATADLPSECTTGDLVVATQDSVNFNKAHWAKKVKYTDDSSLTEFINGLYADTIEALQESIASTQEAIRKMNSDKVLDESEKGYIRTEWEKVNGKPGFESTGSSGSFETTLEIVAGLDYTEGEKVHLSFANYLLTFAGNKLLFKYRGMDDFKAAFYNLRSYLQSMKLYDAGSTEGFDRTIMSGMFTRYYEAQQLLLANAQKDYTSFLELWASDGYISPVEKRSLVTMKQDESQVYANLIATAALYSNASGTASQQAVYAALQAYNQAYTAFLATINYYTDSATWNDSIAIVTESGAAYSWNYITGYFSSRASLENAIDSAVKVRADDFAYLMDAMPDGASTEIGEGVVLSQVIGVKGSNNTHVVAGMTNGKVGADEVPMIFAGAQNFAGANNAKFRVYRDGSFYAGAGNLTGVLQLASATSGRFEDANIYYLPAVSSESTITLEANVKHIGKVIRMFNSGEAGTHKNYKISCQKFGVSSDGSISWSQFSYDAIVRPEEWAEFTCVKVSSSSSGTDAAWELSGRFSQQEFINQNAFGRFPLVLAMGRFVGGSTVANCSINGSIWNKSDGGNCYGTSLKNNPFIITRVSEGIYDISALSSIIPSGSMMMVCGYGYTSGHSNDYALIATVTNQYTLGDYTHFRVDVHDDTTPNEGSFNFIIFGPYWGYKLS